MPGEASDLDTNLSAVAESLFQPAEGGKPTASPSNNDEPEQPSDEPDDYSDETSDEGDEIDPADLDDLSEGEEDYSDDDAGEEVDPDEIEHEVVVDGAPTKAKLKDLKAAYSGNKAIDARLQQAGELRKQSEVLTTELMRQLNTHSEKLKQLDGILAQAENNGIDWDTLRATDPQRYLLEREKQRELQGTRERIQREEAETQQKQEMLMAHRQNEYARQEADQLIRKIPELANPEKARVMGENWSKTGRSYGFKDEEISSIIDHRMLLVLTDAMKYRALVNAKAARQSKGNNPKAAPKPLLRPGSQNFGQRMNNVKAEKEAAARAARTGSIDDVAASLLVAAPRGKTKRTGF